MRVALGADHAGFELKDALKRTFDALGVAYHDFGTDGPGSVDYPDFAAQVASGVAEGRFDRGILVCGSGIGMAIAANKFPQVRAATCHDDLTAEMSRRHNDVNVLCLSADMLGERLIDRMVEMWLNTKFEGGRHARRVSKISALETPDPTAKCAVATEVANGSAD